MWSAQLIFLWLVLVTVMGAAVGAIVALDKAADEHVRDLERVRANPGAAVELPNANLARARAILVIVAAALGVFLFVWLVVPAAGKWVMEELDRKFTKVSVSQVRKARKKEEAAQAERERSFSELGALEDVVFGPSRSRSRSELSSVQLGPFRTMQ